MKKTATLTSSDHPAPALASRRHLLKGLGALLGTGVLAGPSQLLAAPTAPSVAAPASALVGGDEYIGMVKLLAGTTIPQGWALCEGQELSVAQHPALFAMLGNTYGGNGRTTFALPNLGGIIEVPVGADAPDALPARMCAIKMMNAPSTTTALAELYLEHHYRMRAKVS